MPVVGTEARRKIERVFVVLAGCSGNDARTATGLMCGDPGAIILLGSACGFTTGIHAMGATTSKAAEAVKAWPPAPAITRVALAGAHRAKRFCLALIEQITGSDIHSIPENIKAILRAGGA